MSVEEHRLVLLRHGETEWSKSGRHTGRTDLALTDAGCRQAVAAGAVLAGLALEDPAVLVSPRRRARDTAKLAGLTGEQVCEDLAEWDYGRYEGLTTAEIQQVEPDWLIWTHGAPDGESVAQVSDRADRVVALALAQLTDRDVVLVAHAHISRAVISRWLELPLVDGARFGMTTASIAVCGFEHGVRQLAALGLTGSSH